MPKRKRNPATLLFWTLGIVLWTHQVFAVGCNSNRPAHLFAKAPGYRAGLGRADITPNYPVRLNGFGGRRDEASGTSQHLWAKAIALQWQDEQPLVIIAIDNLGIREPMVDAVAKRLEEKYGVPRRNVALTFTHTHCAPKVNGSSDTIFSTAIPPEHQLHIDRYTAELPDLLFAAASQALDNLQPANLEWTVGQVTFAVNRRTPGGPVDHDLPVLFVKDTHGQIMAIYTSYACHCVTLSFNEYSGDWAGYAQELIEREHPGVMGLVSIGCGSDANPQSGVTGNNLAAAADQGQQIATEISRLLTTPTRKISGPVTSRLEHLELPLNPVPDKAKLEELVAQGGAQGYNASWQLAKLNRGEPLQSSLNYPVQSFTFGQDLQMVFLAGEVCVDYALRLKRELNRDKLWVHGYSNDFCAYIPSERLLQEGGYGGGGEIPYFALPTTLAPGMEDKIISLVVRQTPEQFQAEPGTQGIPPKPPEESLACLQTHPELSVQLVAAEPLIADPVAIDFGVDGCLWVAEMPDYGRGVNDEFIGSGRVKRLYDSDGDGQMDTSQVYLDGLRFPTDVKVWRDGVLVCDAPEILFAADRNGDGVAEVREVLLSGFATHNPHARVNSLRFGLDGWVYGSGGLFGGMLTNHLGQVFEVNNRDFRFHPDSGLVEGATGQTQQGRTRDDYDNWFGCNNSMLLMYYAIDDRYAQRNASLRPPRMIYDVPSARHGQQLFPSGSLVLFKLSGPPGRPTSACGAEIYRDRVLGDEYYGNAFVCEPVNQVVHRMLLDRKNLEFVGERATTEQNREFLTSRDQWFRPVQTRTGLDGALYVVDMYRYVIEHSQWIPPETRAELNIFAGQRMGRIYRVVPKSQTNAPIRWPRLCDLSDTDLVDQLTSRNGPVRDTASQLLVWKGKLDQAVAARLHQMIQQSGSPACSASALSVLSSFDEVEGRDLLPLLTSDLPEARRVGIRFCEKHIHNCPELWETIRKLADDPVQAVQLQAVFLLADWKTNSAQELLASLLQTEPPESPVSYAALSSLNEDNAGAILDFILDSRKDWQYTGNISQVVKTATALVTSAARHQILMKLRELGSESRWSEAIKTRSRLLAAADWFEVTASIAESEIADNQEVVSAMNRLLGSARTLLTDADLVEQESILAATGFLAASIGERGRALAFAVEENDLDLLLGVLNASRPPQIQAAVLNQILSGGDPELMAGLLKNWGSLTPAIRSAIVTRLLAREDWTRLLLQSLRDGQITRSDLDSTARQQLLTLDDKTLRAESESLLSMSLESDRAALVEQWQPVLKMTGEFERGRRVFNQHCAACHRLDQVGYEIGPDLAALTNRSPSALMVAILDPNRDIDSRYLAYSALTVDGLTLTGVLSGETAGSVTLKERGDRQHTVLRKDLEELRATRKSAMPEGLEKDLAHQDLADLFAYIGPTRLPRRAFPGNQPVTIQSDAHGNLICPATSAEIFGESLVFESDSTFQNLGYWSGDQDLAYWTVESPVNAAFDVYLDFACSPDSAGNPLVVAGGQNAANWTVASTGAWSEYRWEKVGVLELLQGPNRLSVGFGQPRRGGALLDLRHLVLVPAGQDWPIRNP